MIKYLPFVLVILLTGCAPLLEEDLEIDLKVEHKIP